MQREDPRIQLAQERLTRAEHDLEAAQLLITKPTLASEAGFHAQQAAEKLFKGLLAFNDREFPKTHAVALLLDLLPVSCCRSARTPKCLDALRRGGTVPQFWDGAAAAEAAQALTLAHRVREIVWSKIPPK